MGSVPVTHPDVREAVAKNPLTPDEVLLGMMARECRTIMEREELSVVLVEALSYSTDWNARLMAAKHPECRLGWLERLATDSDNDVKRAAVAHPRWVNWHPVRSVVVEDPTWSPLILAAAAGTAFFVLFMGCLYLVEVSF